ncbi:MAG: ABC transporter ATP-binding protein [Kofleriaceae bacterium]|nr:MAG: ABC transporter ATP-binding protein [Kofleriaceae bacterium]MBZ0234001.1 ABC transporter ATP-binding protein [Kofleriaceae bacterium]
MTTPVLELRGVSKTFYGQRVLSDVSFSIAPGEVFGYIGPNGAGKSTTLKILAGLITQYDGSVTIAGTDVKREPARAHALIGFMPQSCGFHAWRTVESALDLLGDLSGVPADLRKRRIPELLERFHLLDARTKKVKDLSGGMTQKLGLIQALLHEPRLLVLDEPLEGLDPPSRQLLKDVIRERSNAGTTVLFSSHILSDVEHVADRVGILNHGVVATSGSIRDLTRMFDLPTELELELSTAPADTAYLAQAGAAIEKRPGHWRITLPKGVDVAAVDATIHRLVEATLAGGGRLRRIGVAEPALDDLFAHYILDTNRAGAGRGN